MKRNFFVGLLLIGMTIVVSIHFSIGMKNSSFFDVTLGTIESLAGCEVSSNSDNNKYYCLKESDSDKDHCMDIFFALAPACSGNY